jgi:hypothetical protein
MTAMQIRDELYALWSAARAEANLAYEAWCTVPGTTSYAVYRAAEDRADAAEDALRAACCPAEPLPLYADRALVAA